MSNGHVFPSRERPLDFPKMPQAYKNQEFLNGPHARNLRIMCEFEEPRTRLEAHNVENIVMIFGSARSKQPEAYKKAIEEARAKVAANPNTSHELVRLERMSFLCRYHEETVKLGGLITKFSIERATKGLPQYFVGTGAGPGMMEAASEGAWREGGKSIGFGISLPFEQGLNPYVTPELGFEFHYFLTRKFWMAYKCRGLVVAPGGYGTCDELFEILTLIITKKVVDTIPVILFGEKYWNDVLNLAHMQEAGIVTQEQVDLVFTCDTAEQAFDHLQKWWLSQEERKKAALEVAANTPSAIATQTGKDEDGAVLKKLRVSAPTPDRPLPPKAYKNVNFINGPDTRAFRIQCEMEETRIRLDSMKISNILLFVGSGCVMTPMEHVKALSKVDRKSLEYERLMKQEPLLKFHQVARDLARSTTAWSMQRHVGGKCSVHVATDGGIGFMESVNEGAWEAGGVSIGFSGGYHRDGVDFNKYVTPELAFRFHYFFTRKFWMAYKCMGLIAFPGGYCTCDTLFEILTLMQTGKIARKLPIVLIGVDYWKKSIQWEKMAEYGMISDDDVKQLFFTDSAELAFNHVCAYWERLDQTGAHFLGPRSTPKKK